MKAKTVEQWGYVVTCSGLFGMMGGIVVMGCGGMQSSIEMVQNGALFLFLSAAVLASGLTIHKAGQFRALYEMYYGRNR